MAKKPVARSKKSSSKGQALPWIFALIVCVFTPSTMVLLLIGMAPTLVAFFIIDRHPAKYTSRTVGYLNFAGCLPYALDLWQNSDLWSFDRMFEIVGDPFSLLVMYAAAGTGWVILFLTPPVVAAYLSVTNDMKEQRYKARQAELVESWGRNVRHGTSGFDPEDVNEETDSAELREAAGAE